MALVKCGGASATIRKRAALPDSPCLDTCARVRELLSTVMDLSPRPASRRGMADHRDSRAVG